MSVENLVVSYGDYTAVRGVSFEVNPGEIVGLLGVNGAGKTSTVEVIEGYRRPTDGRVRVLGLDPVSDHGAVAARMGVLLQEDALYPGARPEELLHLFARLYDTEPEQADHLLEAVRLTDSRRTAVRKLSGGEKRRLGLALALIGSPPVLVLDEPTSGVDVAGRRIIRDLVKARREEGAAVLLTTHELDEAQRMADRLVIIHDGRIIAEGSVEELTAGRIGSGIRFQAPPGLEIVGLTTEIGVEVTEPEPGSYFVAGEASPQLVARITAWMAERGVMVGDLRAGRHHLEDVFLMITDQAEAAGDPGTPPSSPRSRRPGRSGRSAE